MLCQGAAGWLKDTGCKLEMFLDPDRSLYRALGLPRSVSKVRQYFFPISPMSNQYQQFENNLLFSLKVWGISTIHFYAGELASGRSLPKSQQEEDDPLQMGGDFTLSRWLVMMQKMTILIFRGEILVEYFFYKQRLC